jgi:hypothetical protein
MPQPAQRVRVVTAISSALVPLSVHNRKHDARLNTGEGPHVQVPQDLWPRG